MRFIVHLLVIALALWVTAYILPGVEFTSWQALAISAIRARPAQRPGAADPGAG